MSHFTTACKSVCTFIFCVLATDVNLKSNWLQVNPIRFQKCWRERSYRPWNQPWRILTRRLRSNSFKWRHHSFYFLEGLEKRPETIAQVVHHGNPHANQVKEPFPPAMESNKGKVVGIVVEARLAKEVTSLDFLRRIS